MAGRCIFPQSFPGPVDAKIAVEDEGDCRVVINARGAQSSPTTMVDFNTVAFRTPLICRMHELLSEDACIRDPSQLATQQLMLES
jgi:hypothetical protein